MHLCGNLITRKKKQYTHRGKGCVGAVPSGGQRKIPAVVEKPKEDMKNVGNLNQAVA